MRLAFASVIGGLLIAGMVGNYTVALSGLKPSFWPFD